MTFQAKRSVPVEHEGRSYAVEYDGDVITAVCRRRADGSYSDLWAARWTGGGFCAGAPRDAPELVRAVVRLAEEMSST
jgi:hypothetical protein